MPLFGRRPTPKPDNTTTIILAGGRSERFGSPKALARLQDRPLVQWAAHLAAAVSVRTLLVVAPDEEDARWRDAIGQTQRSLPPKAKGKKVLEPSLEIVHDPAPYMGPVAGVQAALPQVRTPFVLLLAVDMPRLRPDLLLGLNDRLVGHDAVAYHIEGWWRPFPSLWKRDALEMAVRRADQQSIHSLHGLLDLVDARPLGPEFLALFDATQDALKSVNTKEDLDTVAERLGGSS